MPRTHAVRQPIRVRENSRRTLDQRLLLRFPSLLPPYGRLVARLAPSSRLRKAVVSIATRRGMEAFNRRDLDAATIGTLPNFEYYPPRDAVDIGFWEPCYRGREGFGEYTSAWTEVFGGALRAEPIEVIDTGDSIVLLAEVPARAQASGVPFRRTLATVTSLERGLVSRVDVYWEHADALEAAGLPRSQVSS
jgi:ketosteroid isomerase-like protein